MACSFPALSPEESDESLTPPRSPSRLDFCAQDSEYSDTQNDPDDVLDPRLDEAALNMDWPNTHYSNHCAYSSVYVEEDANEIDSAPLSSSRLPIIEFDEDCPPDQGSCLGEDTSTSHTFPVPPEIPLYQPVIEPRAPTPVRPSLIQPHLDVQEPTHLSRVAAQRLNYPHHGFSRSSFLHQKSFWTSRHEEWVEWQTRMEQEEAPNSAYTGIAAVERRTITNPPPSMRSPPSGLERDLREHPSGKYELDVYAPIYPRVGDISALRDPYSVNIDRCFCKFPLWTLHKTLYVFEMYQGSSSFPSSPAGITSAKIPESDSSSTLSSYTSAGSEDDEDSDDTLVSEDPSVSKYHTPAESSSRSPSSLSLSKSHSWNRFYESRMSWYARWELLIGLVQRDESQRQALGLPAKLPSPVEEPVMHLVPPEPIFRHAGEDGNEDSDEEEDYGTLVSNPIFSADVEDVYQRSIAFFDRESRRAGEALPV